MQVVRRASKRVYWNIGLVILTLLSISTLIALISMQRYTSAKFTRLQRVNIEMQRNIEALSPRIAELQNRVTPQATGIDTSLVELYNRVTQLTSRVAELETPSEQTLLRNATEHMLTVTHETDRYLGIPAVVRHPNNTTQYPYFALREGLKVRYLKNIFSTNQPDLLWIPEESDGKTLLRWQTAKVGSAGLYGIFPGNILTLLDNELYDFGVGTRFVKVRLEEPELVGYTLLETIIGETEVVDDALWAAEDIPRLKKTTVLDYKGCPIYAVHLPSFNQREIGHWIKILADPTTYPTALNGAQPGGVHPVFATTTVNSLLLHTLQTEGKEAEKQAIRQAVQHFFENYVFSTKTPRADQSVSWPYHFPWTMNWGIRLSPPWYSAYTNGVVTQTAALLYALTGEQRYQVLALEAAQYLNTSISKGGAEYEVAGFHLPAEYVYNTPPLPNVRVLDGEFITITALYNGARLLGDSQLLHIFMRQAFSLAMQLAYYVQPDGNLYFSTYIEEMPMHYKWVLWSNLQALANITKDRRFFDVAKVLRPHIPDFWCQSNGC
jgi:hypothetical protein